MRSPLAIALLLCGCGELGLTVDVSAKEDVPQLDAVRIEIVQGPLLVEQTFALGSTQLPQSIAIVSKGLTRGEVQVTVQGLAQGRVEAIAHVTGTLKPATSGVRVAAVLERFCSGATCGCTPQPCSALTKPCGLTSDSCGGQHDCGACSGTDRCEGNTCVPQGCKPMTCAQAGASCGMLLDGCGGTLDCGQCDAGLNCGGSGVANVCGPGTCMPRTRCDAGMECDSATDGCGGLLSCGTCDAGACGADGTPFRCPCVPRTLCPPGKQCGTWPNGCNTAMLSCGNCTLPETCAGSGQANMCGCTPIAACPQFACGAQPNGCGSMIMCSTNCTSGRTCSSLDGGPTRCNCTNNTTECNGTCVNLETSSTNCGACGRSCPLGQACVDGMCPCVDAGSNLDGHCCPVGWFLGPQLESPVMRCFKGPFDAGTEAQGHAQCRQETLQSWGVSVSALGGTLVSSSSGAAPAGACGSFLRGRNNQVIDAESNAQLGGNQVCNPLCSGANCVCTTCTCSDFDERACAQKFYCVMDTLGPRVEGMCAQSSDCPVGMLCGLDGCSDAGLRICALDSDCAGSGSSNCNQRGTLSSTGLCQ